MYVCIYVCARVCVCVCVCVRARLFLALYVSFCYRSENQWNYSQRAQILFSGTFIHKIYFLIYNIKQTDSCTLNREDTPRSVIPFIYIYSSVDSDLTSIMSTVSVNERNEILPTCNLLYFASLINFALPPREFPNSFACYRQ